MGEGRKMKDSGIEWIGEIPEDWYKVRLKDFYHFEKGANSANYTQEYIGENSGEFPVYSGQTENSGIMGKINTFDYDIDECLFTTTVGAKVMTPKILRGKFSLSQNCLIMKRIKYCDNRFFFFILLPLFEFEKSLIPSHMQPSLRISDLNKYQLFIPNHIYQQKIANFLDRKVGDIDRIIKKTRESIEEYKKYKQSLITETVTKGLDKKVKMKDSGIEWIGEIPEHWSLSKLKFLFQLKKNIAGTLGFNILSVTQSGLKIKDISSNEGQLSSDYSKYQIVKKGDFVMNHMDLLTGWIDFSNLEGVTSPDYRVFEMKRKINYSNEYYKFIFQICYSNKIFYGLGQGVSTLGRWRLQTDKFINFILPVPPIEEQIKIAKFINDKIINIQLIISQKELLISTLESYKKSLIYEAVTGKLEVS